MSVFVSLTMKALLITLTQAFTHWVQTMQRKAKEKETAWKHYWLFYMKIQPRKVKIMKIRASWDPLNFGGPGKVSPVPRPPPPPPHSWWACLCHHTGTLWSTITVLTLTILGHLTASSLYWLLSGTLVAITENRMRSRKKVAHTHTQTHIHLNDHEDQSGWGKPEEQCVSAEHITQVAHLAWGTVDREIFTLKIIRVKNFRVDKSSRFRSIREFFFNGWLLQYGRALGEFLVFSLLPGIRRARDRSL